MTAIRGMIVFMSRATSGYPTVQVRTADGKFFHGRMPYAEGPPGSTLQLANVVGEGDSIGFEAQLGSGDTGEFRGKRSTKFTHGTQGRKVE